MDTEYWKSSPFGENSIFHPSWEEKEKERRQQKISKIKEEQQPEKSKNEEKTEIKVVSKALNTEGTPLKYDAKGCLEKGQERLWLFTIKTAAKEKSTMIYADFIKKYQFIFNENNPLYSFSFTINNQEQSLRKYAELISVNPDETLLKKAVHITGLNSINSFLRRAKKQFPNGLTLLEKVLYWNHGKKYDYKFTQAHGYPLVYVKDIGLIESDHIGNMVFGNIMQKFLLQALHDGDYIQNGINTTIGNLKGIDDPYDSYAIAVGAISGDFFTQDDFWRLFDFNKSVQISEKKVKTFYYKMKYVNPELTKIMYYDQNFKIIGD